MQIEYKMFIFLALTYRMKNYQVDLCRYLATYISQPSNLYQKQLFTQFFNVNIPRQLRIDMCAHMCERLALYWNVIN